MLSLVLFNCYLVFLLLFFNVKRELVYKLLVRLLVYFARVDFCPSSLPHMVLEVSGVGCGL